MAIGLESPYFWMMLIASAAGLFLFERKLGLRWRPAAVIRLGLVVFLLVGFFSSRNIRVGDDIPWREILVIDQSDSLPLDVRRDLREQGREWIDAGENRLLMVYGIGGEVVLSGDWPQGDGRASNLSDALELASQLLGENPGRVLLASDGIPNSITNTELQVTKFVDAGIVLDIAHLQPTQHQNDLFTGKLIIPSGFWEHSSFNFILPIYSPISGQTAIQLFVNDVLQNEQIVEVNAGENLISLTTNTGVSGIMTIKTVALWEGDNFVDNNSSYAAIEVFPAPHIMMVTENEVIAGLFRQTLVNLGMQVDFFSPEEIPVDIASLEFYQVIIIHNLLASNISLEQMLTLKIFVSQMGRGLIFLGGRNSYSLGGYENTTLEGILPVELTPPDRGQGSPITFVLVLDRSGSMGIGSRNGITPIDLTREAAIRTIETLRAEDYIGVLTFSGTTSWDVDIRPLGDGVDLRLAQDAVSRIVASGGTKVYQALAEAVYALTDAHQTDSTHILLMSDGISGDGSPEEFQRLAQVARNLDITISTIALGSISDPETMELIATEGNGRYYEILDPEDLPQVMVAEGKAAHGENIQLGETNLVSGEDRHPILYGFSLDDLPTIRGYNALRSKTDQGAEDILLSGNLRDPLLSAWQVGLGRVIAWMGDIGEEWSKNWQFWPERGDFWLNVIRYAAPYGSYSPVQTKLSTTESQLILELHIYSSAGVPVNLASPTFSFVGGGETVTTYPIPQVAPGLYKLEISLPSIGAYRGMIKYQDAENVEEIAVPFAVNYPREWQPADAQEGRANMIRWAEMTGGKQIDLFEELLSSEKNNGEESEFSFTNIILLLLVISWPIEIALRRKWMPWN